MVKNTNEHLLFQEYQKLASAPIEDAVALPFAVYHDPSVYQAEAEYIFHREWIFVCHEQQLSNEGDYLALDIAGEAIAVIRGQDGQLRALSNICRHRGTPLLDEGYGNIKKNIVCPYHAWTYDDSGKLKGVPFAGDIHVEKEKHCLPRFHLDSWMGLLFINLGDEPEPLINRTGCLQNFVDVFEPQKLLNCYQGNSESWEANWKLAFENAIESYHLFKVHKETLEKQSPSKDTYYVAGSSESSLSGGKLRDDRSRLMKWITGDSPEVYNHYLLISLPPSFVGILTYGSFDWLQILPKGPLSSVVSQGGLSNYFVSKGEVNQDQLTQDFLEEDKLICERVQRGMHSRIAQGGKLVSMENILVDFRQFLASRLFDSTPDAYSESNQAKLFLNFNQ
ncbi:aromatic ring-hydroxylating oxygenase subunit alpha [Aliikangiella coralliicola]|uniref:Aromatic ring-hydroxylating dioxygenase subunit alpha n=1 Tax=Aliikangiella coralliicola TaxID=2592383 RepID=A0A545UCG8_9GAMM|nr:aromatic ring-hydroxylating dioxygenase subunit alpha [Aliikangiella coralliicola]TQV87157.1 aromatic ring-hydroxylating dioxygenase subunit alpha [Aliikangiella coralliicola]